MLLVFDYDGTLHDTAKLYGNAFREAYADLVRDHYAPDRYYSDSDMARYLGLSPPDMWHTFMPDLPEEVWKKASLKVREGMITGIENGKAVLYAGATDMLDKLKGKGYRMVILSNGYHAYLAAHRNYFELDRWFDGYYCSEDWKFVPKEEIMQGIMRDYPDENYIIIGDRDSDFRAGIAINVPVIGCAYGFGTEEELAMCNAVADAPASIPGIIAGLV